MFSYWLPAQMTFKSIFSAQNWLSSISEYKNPAWRLQRNMLSVSQDGLIQKVLFVLHVSALEWWQKISHWDQQKLIQVQSVYCIKCNHFPPIEKTLYNLNNHLQTIFGPLGNSVSEIYYKESIIYLFQKHCTFCFVISLFWAGTLAKWRWNRSNQNQTGKYNKHASSYFIVEHFVP